MVSRPSADRSAVPVIRPVANDVTLILSGSPPALRKLVRDKPEDTHLLAHRGTSMNPTLRADDLLEIVAYGERRLRTGDVVLITPSADNPAVVHRVVRCLPDRLWTRGDNNSRSDASILGPDQIAGQVVAAWRGEKRRRIPGGFVGRVTSGLTRRLCALDRWASRLLHPIYRSLSRSGAIRNLLTARFKPELVIFQAGGTSLPRLMMGGRVLGQYDPRNRQWVIRRPFRLLVDEQVLEQARCQLKASQETDRRNGTAQR